MRLLPAVIALFACHGVSLAADDVFKPEQVHSFETEVQPLLTKYCAKCHVGEKLKGNLDLSSREGLLKGGDLGPAVDLKAPAKSLILKAVHWTDGLEMPPTGKLPAKDIETLTKWVADGTPWSATTQPSPVKKEVAHKGGVVTEEAKKYWAYLPLKRPAVPTVKNAGWVKSPIDAFILAKLEEKDLTPAKPADRIALLRRVHYDLTGLPPTPAEVDEFLKEANPQAAYQRVIDKLLASPQYGEKWGRHWLDLVRYAETNGYERDGAKPHVWRYRDYVIRSFNADKPFDRFIKEQLAGDEIDRNDPDCVIATGFYRLGLWDDEPADRLLARFDELDDWVATTSQVFLGMTMNCARCHEHKIDPIPHADYYKMVAFFQDVGRYDPSNGPKSAGVSDVTPVEKRKVYEKELAERQTKLEEIAKRMTTIENEAIKGMSAEEQRAAEGPARPDIVRKVPKYLKVPQAGEYALLKSERDKLNRTPPPSQELALSVNNCAVKPPATSVLIRGNPGSPGAAVEPGFPAVLGFDAPKIPEPPRELKSSGRRTVLANWIASPENPLTARVIANRIWQYHFGRGIVPTPNDFGKFGEQPTHPELLNWLASEFIAQGWSFKKMHKLILLSNAYQMGSAADPKALATDPGNSLFWRFNMRRLTAEEVRDSFLAVSGKLNLKMGGPSIFPKIPQEVLAGQSVPGSGWGKSPPEEASRRSVYVHLKRSLLVPILVQYDQADTDSTCPVRYTTTVPTQALGMLNGEFSNESAAAMAERLSTAGDLAAQVRLAIRLTTCRAPAEDEVKKDVAFIESQMKKHKLSRDEAMKRYCLLALNANEFVYLD